jgi:hypothetical protein
MGISVNGGRVELIPCLKDLFTHEETKLAGRIEGCVSASIAIVTVEPSYTLPSSAILGYILMQ